MADHKIVHWELMGPDAEKLGTFYSDLFGWDLQAYPGMDGYNVVDGEQSGIGGAVGSGNEHMPSYQAMYIQVNDVAEHLDMAAAAGGSTVLGKTVVPGVVTFGLFNDPAGNLVGVVEAETPPAE